MIEYLRGMNIEVEGGSGPQTPEDQQLALKSAESKRPLTEEFVQERIIEFLGLQGWSRDLRTKSVKQHGVDIRVRHNNYARYWLVEVKGDASPSAKFPRSHREVQFNLALGQIITRMHTGGARGYKYRYKYGVGYPASFKDMAVRRLPYDVCDKLNLSLFFVDENGAVELLDWQALKKLQTKPS